MAINYLKLYIGGRDMKDLNEKEIERLSKKSITEKIIDGDWYQYSKEEWAQKTVKTSAQTIYKINKLAAHDTNDADKMLKEFLPNMEKSAEIYFPISTIEWPEMLKIGSGTFINSNLQILSAGQITIGEHCFIGPNCQLYTPNHHSMDKNLRREGWQYDAPITIGDDCWFGGSVIVLPGVTIGDNVVVGAGSVVTKDVPDNVLIAGNPARIIKTIG